MAKKSGLKRQLKKLWASQKALAIPVTYLMLFFSLLIVISLTYSLAVAKIGAQSSALKASVAKQNMLTLDDAVHSVAWSFGASKIVYMDDCGGFFQTQSTEKHLAINFTDGQSFFDIVFNSSVGKAAYELEPSESLFASTFIKGDDRSIANESDSTMTQLYVAVGDDAQELTLCYRPSATVAVIGTSNGKPLNLIRIYIISLNSSQNLSLKEGFYLKVTALNVTVTAYQYEFNESLSHLTLKVTLDEIQSIVKLPISSNSQGAIVNLEIVLCNVRLQKTEV
jgi:hypothetical protein